MPHPLETLGRVNLGEQVYDRIAGALLEGRMRPNDKLTMRGLADQLGVSTTPIRDAVNQLTREQVLEQRSPKDVRVPVMDQKTYLEILDIRLELEGLAAQRAAQRARPAQIRDLRKLLERNDRAIAQRNHRSATDCNQKFHLALSRIADMPNLQNILNVLWLRMGPLVACYHDLDPPRLNELHHAVVQAMQAADGARARDAIRSDILEARPAMLDQIAALQAQFSDKVAAE